MRKLFSLLTAVLFAGSMMAIDFTLSSAESVTKDGVTVTFAKGSGTTAPTWYEKGLRLYAKNEVTITSESNITAISFNWEKQGTKAFAEASASTGSYTHPTEAGVGAWTGSATSVTFTLGATGQLQLNTFSVTVGEGGGDTPGGDTPGGDTPGGDTPGGDTPGLVLTCAEAVAAAQAGSTQKATVRGYVTEIAYAWSSGSMSFWMADTQDGGKVFEAYKCECAEADAPAVGDLVEATGNLTLFKTTAELAAGCTVVIIKKAGGDTPGGDTPGGDTPAGPKNLGPKTIAEFLELKNTTDTCILTGVVSNITNTTYGNFDLTDATGTVYVYGLLNAAGESKKFAELGVAENDTLTVKAIYNEYNNKAQAKNAIFVEVKKSSAPVVEPVNLGEKTIAEFLALANTKDTCILTGVVANVANNQYGNFDLVELGNAEVKVYVYGLLTAAGETKKCFEEENIAEGDTLKVKAIYTTYNNNPQVKNAIFVEVKKAGSVTPGAEVEITIADGSFSDYVESYGYWIVEAQNADYYISLSNDDLEIAQAAGTYTATDLYAEDSYILTETDSISFVSGSIVLDVNAEGVATVTGSLVGNDGITYILNIVCPAPDEHEYDDDSDFIRNFSSYTIDTQYLSEYGDIYVEASDADGYQIVLDLYVPTGASGLVAGTYEINSTYEAGTVAAGIYDSGIYPSYAGIATTEGLTNVWYLVSGTVVVDANLNITVNALNSLGHTIKVTLSAASQTGIEETLAAGKAAKVVRDGQVRILKADKTFDVTGARIR